STTRMLSAYLACRSRCAAQSLRPTRRDSGRYLLPAQRLPPWPFRCCCLLAAGGA
ncbi:hypothetical protein IWW56_005389, partial [Coemansia sp. RSA 2131]